MNEVIDLLQIKIEKAKRELPAETANAIAAVDWKAAILGLRAKRGYNFEQLGDLELETELVLCGLLPPEDYPKELEKRMRISSKEANEVVNEMNDLVFKKIREELIKNTERKKAFVNNRVVIKPAKEFSMNVADIIKAPETENIQRVSPETTMKDAAEEKSNAQVLNSAGIKIIEPDLTIPELSAGEEEPKPVLPSLDEEKTHPMLTQKLSGTFQIPTVNTDHSLDNISKTVPTSYPPKRDPYRLSPDE